MPKKRRISGLVCRLLDVVEAAGNKVPEPASAFFLLGLLLLPLSWILSSQELSAVNPAGGAPLVVVNLLEKARFAAFFGGIVDNFQNFTMLAPSLMIMAGIAVAQKTGMLEAVCARMIGGRTKKFAAVIVIFAGMAAGTLAAIAAAPAAGIPAAIAAAPAAVNAVLAVLPPLAAAVFAAAGWPPLAGVFAALSGMAAAWTAIPAGETAISAVQTAISGAQTSISAADSIFRLAAFFLFALTALLVTEFVTAPRYQKDAAAAGKSAAAADKSAIAAGKSAIAAGKSADAIDAGIPAELRYQERQGIRFASVTFLLGIAVLITLSVGRGAFMADSETGSLVTQNAPLIKSIALVFTALLLFPGVVYGICTGVIRRKRDAGAMITSALSELGAFLVIVFVFAQFAALLNQSNLAAVLAAKSMNALSGAGLTRRILILSGAALSKAAAAFFPAIPLLFVYMKRYKKDAGFGTLIANLLPYAVCFFTVWAFLLFVFSLDAAAL